eukprot:1816384-Prymnesium_polylepis.1
MWHVACGMRHVACERVLRLGAGSCVRVRVRRCAAAHCGGGQRSMRVPFAYAGFTPTTWPGLAPGVCAAARLAVVGEQHDGQP